MELTPMEYPAAVQALVQLREDFLTEYSAHPDRASLTGAAAGRAFPRTEVDSAALSAYIIEFTKQYARLWKADSTLPGLSADFSRLEFRRLTLNEGLSIEIDGLASTEFELWIDLKDSRIPSLEISLADGTAVLNVELSNCTMSTLRIRGAGVRGDHVTVGGVGIGTGGRLRLRDSKISDLVCDDVAWLRMDLQDSVVSNELRLSRVTTSEPINLQRTQCGKKAQFDRCKFYATPDVHGAVFPSNTIFIDCEFGFQRDWRWWRNKVYSADAAENFRVMKVAMKNAGAVLEEMRFFALEMRERRLIVRSRGAMSGTDRIVSRLYDMVSCYGTSIGRALSSFVLWNCVFMMLFFCLGREGMLPDAGKTPVGRSAVVKPGIAPVCIPVPVTDHLLLAYPAAGYTLQNIISPGAVLSKSGLMPMTNWPVLVLSVIQSLGSLALAALLLLAIRGKFQRGS